MGSFMFVSFIILGRRGLKLASEIAFPISCSVYKHLSSKGIL